MPWDLTTELRAWQERLERLTQHHAESWAPPIDVYETAANYIVTAEVPGLTRDQVQLQVEDGRLTIHGARAPRRGGSAEIVHFHLVERGHGSFARTFAFADKIDPDRVTAEMADGVLTITLPKVPPPPARKIEVR
jgi:HSP20 family protein